MKKAGFLILLVLFALQAEATLTPTVDVSGPFVTTNGTAPYYLVIPTQLEFQVASDLTVVDAGKSSAPRVPASILQLGSDYTITGGGYTTSTGGVQTGNTTEMQSGNITIKSGMANSVLAGDLIYILRSSKVNQITAFSSGGYLTGPMIEQALDKTAMISQNAVNGVATSLHVESWETKNSIPPNLLMPLATRAGKYVAFDKNGNVMLTTNSVSTTNGVQFVTGTAGQISAITTNNNAVISLVATAVTPGSYTNTNLTVDSYGRITLASTGNTGVTSVSAVGQNGIGATTTNSTTNPVITLNLGSITPSAVTTSGLESVGFLKTTALTGYLYGNSSSNVSASTTIPSTAITGLATVATTGNYNDLLNKPTLNAGTVTSVATSGSVNGITLTGGPITSSGTITLGGTLSGISNSQLTNNSITVTAGTGLSGGGTVALGGTITLNASGGGTVSSVSVSPNSGVTAGVTNSTTTPTISIGLGAITPTSVTTNTMTFGVNTGVLTVSTGTVGSAAITGSGQAVFNSGPSISAPTITGAATAVNLTTSGLESVANLKTSGLTGYLYGNSTTNVTASTTIPTSSLSGSVSLTSQVSGILPIANGGTGSSTASLVAGTGIAITGTFPNQTINATSGTGTVTSVAGTGTVQGITLTGTVTTSGSLTLGGSLSPIALATQVSGTLNASSGGTGVAGTITGYEYANGTGAHTASTTIPTTALSGTITNAQLTNNSITVTAGSGLSGGGSVALGGTTTLTNAGVTNIVAGTGITVNAATGSVTINSTATGGVSSITGTTNQVIASASTGAVTLSTPQSIATTSTPQFARMGLGIPADPNVGLLTLFSPTASPSFGFETAGSWVPNANSQTYTNAYLQSGISGSTYTGSTYYNLYLGSGTSSGNLANAYQLYIGALSSGTTGTTKYGIYQAGTDANLLSGTLSVSNSTSSTSTTSGALQVNGGVGVGGALNVGGNVAIGTTPSAWGSYDAGTIQKSYGAWWASQNNQSAFGLNSYFNGSNWIYSNSNNASIYAQGSGQHQWYTAPSGTAGNTIPFTQVMTLDASGNLGLGVTPSAWSQGKAFEMYAAGYGIWNGSGAPSSMYMLANAYFNGGFKYGGTGQASHYYQYQGAHVWSTAPSGTAGNAITFTQAMTLDSSGSLFAGSSSQVTGSAGVTIGQNTTSLSAKNFFRVNNRGLATTDTNTYTTGGIVFGGFRDVRNPADIASISCIRTPTAGGNSSAGALVFGVGGGYSIEVDGVLPTEAMRIDASGQLLLGTTTPVATGAGSLTVGATTASTNTTSGALTVAGGVGVGGALYAGGTIVSYSASPQIIAAPSSGNAYIQSARPSSSTGQVGYQFATGYGIDWYNYEGVSSNDLNWYSTSVANNVMRLSSAGVLQLNTYGAGTLVTNSSGIISASSDVRLKNVKHPFTTGLKAITQIHPAVYSWKSEEKEGVHTTYAGFIAQDVKEAIPEAVGQGKDGYLTLQDRAITAALVNAIKEQQKEIEDLQQQIKQLSKQP